jgi:hypothetical protein
MKRQRTTEEIVELVRAMHWWIDRQIEGGKSDDEIVADLPAAFVFIAGRPS